MHGRKTADIDLV